ncbi:hypothetical protein OSJ57_22200, partial [Sphingomonas sp. HH69]
YLSLNMLPASESAHIRAGRWDKMTGLQVMARHRATHAGEVERLREALRPFATFAETFVGDDGWIGPMNKERIVDWFGPSDFSIARQAMIDTSPIDTYEMEPIDTSFGVGEG